ncbi:hypothetical protein ACF0H5_010875 [Mactra antiquata]
MDINELLCVGRSRQIPVDKSNKTLARVGLSADGSFSNSDPWTFGDTINTVDNTDSDTMFAPYPSGSLTPPKKSILRGRPVSPKFVSPSSSARSVRFCDKDGEDEAMFVKLHVNETTQTSHGKINRSNHNPGKPGTHGRCRLVDDLDLSDTQEIKTSTPRNSKSVGIPSLDFLSPRHFTDRQTKMLSTSPKASEQKQRKEKMVIDIDITPRSMGRPTTVVPNKDSPRESKFTRPDGQKIIQNMSFNESPKMSEKLPMPDGSKITQNMDLGHVNLNSTGTQTMSASSSPRSASPETPLRNPFPDGSKIVRNLELGALDPRVKMKIESVQTVDKESEPKFKTMGVQTADEISEPENDKCRSISMQTDLDLSDIFTDSEDDGEDSRSISTQTQDINKEIPDGARITKNMETHKHQKPNPSDMTKSTKLQSCSVTKLPNSSLNDSNWNDFIKRLEEFDPTPSESEESDDEFVTATKNEPVIVYNSHQQTSPIKVDDISPVQHHESMSAKKRLESGEFKRQQYESVLQEQGLLEKLKPNSKKPQYNGAAAPEAKQIQHVDIIPKVAKNQHTSPQRATSSNIARQSQISQMQTLGKPVEVPIRPTPSIQSYVYRDSQTQHGNLFAAQDVSSSPSPQRKSSLTFTPIETYSFKAESLNIETTAKSVEKTSVSKTTAERNPKNVTSAVKESATRNSYIQGLDLGPIPSTKSDRTSSIYGSNEFDRQSYTTDYHASSYSTSSSSSTKRYMQPTLSSQAAGRSYCFTPSHGGGSYSYPVSKSSDTSGFSSSYSARNYNSLHSRPSSAPSSRSRGHQLSSSLREMRNTAARKSAMNSVLDPKRKSSYDFGSSKYSSTGRSSYSTSSSKRFGSPYKSYEDYDLYSYTGSRSSTSNKPRIGTTCSYSKRNTSPVTPREYMSALNDISNARLERSRSRSRSPMFQPKRSYDSSTLYSKSSYDVDKEVEALARNAEKDEGYITSITTSRAHASPVPSASASEKSERQSRPLTRKPPLPTKSKRSGSRESSREYRKSSRSPSVGKSSKRHEEPVQAQHRATEQIGTMCVDTTSGTGAVQGTSTMNTRNKTDKLNTGPITIGSVPSSVIDKTAMYLGHETIQKIINEAKL